MPRTRNTKNRPDTGQLNTINEVDTLDNPCLNAKIEILGQVQGKKNDLKKAM